MKFSLKLISAITIILLFQNCAQRGSPSGGDIDEMPPVIISASPDHKSTNFNSKKIKINFNEYIRLMDLSKHLIISPPIENKPIIIPQGSASKFITIKMQDTLKPNTTYTFNFGNSIVDNNEGNILESFKYIFSTGDYIDSLAIKGNVNDAFEYDSKKRISLFLYNKDENFNDSIIYNKKPNYIAKSKIDGTFELTNLKEGSYLLIAIDDVSNNYYFDPREDQIGFLEDFVTLPTDSLFDITFFKETKPFKFLRASEINFGNIHFAFEGKPEELELDLVSNNSNSKYDYRFYKEPNKDSINYWYKLYEHDSLLQPDSLVFHVKAQNEILDTVVLKPKKQEVLPLKVTKETGSTLQLRDSLTFTFNIPLEKIKRSKIKLFDEDSSRVNFTTHINKNKTELKLNFIKKFNHKYQINTLPGAFIDFFNQENDTLDFKFSTKHPDDYGILNLQLAHQNAENLIIDLLNKDLELVERRFSKGENDFKYVNLPPNEYIIRIIYDKNDNKSWDTGNYLKKIKPEKVIYYQSVIELRANWEIFETFTF